MSKKCQLSCNTQKTGWCCPIHQFHSINLLGFAGVRKAQRDARARTVADETASAAQTMVENMDKGREKSAVVRHSDKDRSDHPEAM